MNKLGICLLIIWTILAVVSFISSFWAPLYFKIIGLAFGSLNVIAILTWVISMFALKGQQSAIEEIIKNK